MKRCLASKGNNKCWNLLFGSHILSHNNILCSYVPVCFEAIALQAVLFLVTQVKFSREKRGGWKRNHDCGHLCNPFPHIFSGVWVASQSPMSVRVSFLPTYLASPHNLFTHRPACFDKQRKWKLNLVSLYSAHYAESAGESVMRHSLSLSLCACYSETARLLESITCTVQDIWG